MRRVAGLDLQAAAKSLDDKEALQWAKDIEWTLIFQAGGYCASAIASTLCFLFLCIGTIKCGSPIEEKKKEEKSAALLLEGWRKVCRSCSTITVYATWPYIHQAVCVLCNVTYLRTMGEFVTMWQENHKSRLLIKYCSTRLVPLHGSRSGLQTTQRIATPSQTTLTFCWYAHFKSKPNATV